MTWEAKHETRAAFADGVLSDVIMETGCEHGYALGNLLCDLMHWAVFNEFDFELVLDRARDHFQQEVAECR